MSPNNFTKGHLLNIEWLTANVPSVSSPAREERDVFGIILDVFWPVQPAIVVGEPLYDLGIPS